MNHIKVAAEATEALEQALLRYTSASENLTRSERRLGECRAAYEKEVASFDDSDKAHRRVRQTSDEVEVAKMMVGKFSREAKSASQDLINPTRVAREVVTEAIRAESEKHTFRLVNSLLPFFADERSAAAAAQKIIGATSRASCFVGGPGAVFHADAGIEVLARAILIECKQTLRRLAE